MPVKKSRRGSRKPVKTPSKSSQTVEIKYHDPSRTPGFSWRVSLSILAFFGWIIFLIIWLFFYAGNFSVYQNIAILIVSLLVFIAINGAAWASWGVRYGRKIERI
jgi:hypothetical protein